MTRDLKTVVGTEGSTSVWLGGIGVDFKIGDEMTGGAFSIIEHPMDPGRLVPPHIHHREDELSYVLSGRIGVRVGAHDQIVGAGNYVFKPRDIPHTFWNPGPEPARLLEIIWPAGFENFFAELGALAESCPPEEFPNKRAELAREYDHHYVHPEWVPELMARYDLKLLGED